MNVVRLPLMVLASRRHGKHKSYSTDVVLDMGLLAVLCSLAPFAAGSEWFMRTGRVFVVGLGLLLFSNALLWGGAWAYSNWLRQR
jgi:fucose permease